MRVDNTMYGGKGSTELEMYDGYAIRYTNIFLMKCDQCMINIIASEHWQVFLTDP